MMEWWTVGRERFGEQINGGFEGGKPVRKPITVKDEGLN